MGHVHVRVTVRAVQRDLRRRHNVRGLQTVVRGHTVVPVNTIMKMVRACPIPRHVQAICRGRNMVILRGTVLRGFIQDVTRIVQVVEFIKGTVIIQGLRGEHVNRFQRRRAVIGDITIIMVNHVYPVRLANGVIIVVTHVLRDISVRAEHMIQRIRDIMTNINVLQVRILLVVQAAVQT